MIRILYYTSAVTGTGHLVQGISIYNALSRNYVRGVFCILHNSMTTIPFRRLNIRQISIPFEDECILSHDNYQSSELFSAINFFNPDVLIVDLSWFMLHSFINELHCKKVFLCRQISEKAFSVPLESGRIEFNPEYFDLLIQTEPFDNYFEMKQINPIIIKSRDEILSKVEAQKCLDVNGSNPVCMFALNGSTELLQRTRKTYSYLEEEGYDMVYSANYEGGLFPVIDYFNAVDLLICGGGYNAFWESVYFQKDAIYVAVPTIFEDQQKRIKECSDYMFEENGADQLVDILMNL